MRALDHLSLKWKLALAPAMCLLLLGLSAAGAMWGLAQQRTALDSVVGQRLPAYGGVTALEADLREMNALIHNSIGFEAMGLGSTEVGAVDTALGTLAKRLRKDMAERVAAAKGTPDEATWAALGASFAAYDKAVQSTLDTKFEGTVAAAGKLKAAQKDHQAVLAGIGQLRDTAFAAARADVAAASAGAVRAQGAIAAAAAVALAAGVALTVLLARGLLGRVRRLSQALEQLGAGDLEHRVEAQGRDEVAQLMTGLEALRLTLARSIAQVRSASESVRVAAGEISSGNTDLSQRTEHQASSLQQTAASMEQISGTVRSSAETARQATQLAATASSVAARGGAVVSQVVATMEQISESSRRIGDIIGTIDGIAFQTNILALNAAVEAARAGEQGRGFAVVAGEVRTLAQRSAEAAREIKSLIGTSVERVETGHRLVGEAGQTMGDIVAQVQRVSDLIDEISTATQEQNAGIGQVSTAVSDLDRVTQQNAALVEQAAAAADSLTQQATRLVDSVSVFRVEAHAV